MKYLRLSLFFLVTLLFASACSEKLDTNFLEFEDQGELSIAWTTIIDGEEITIESGTKLDSSQFNQITVTAEQDERHLFIMIFFDEMDTRFINALAEENGTIPEKGFYRKKIENYDSTSYPYYFEVGTHTIKAFEFDPEGNRNHTPNSRNIKAVKTITYEVVD